MESFPLVTRIGVGDIHGICFGGSDVHPFYLAMSAFQAMRKVVWCAIRASRGFRKIGASANNLAAAGPRPGQRVERVTASLQRPHDLPALWRGYILEFRGGL